MRRRVASALLGALLLGPSARAGVPSLCGAGETVVFGCAHGAKVVSLCADPAGGGRTRLRYLYGAPGRVELEVSRPDAFTSAVSGRSGGGYDYVRVKNGDAGYVLYTGEGKGWSQDGWIVERQGAPVSHHVCRRGGAGPQVWSPVYAAKLPEAPDADTFDPPDWEGAAPRHAGRP